MHGQEPGERPGGTWVLAEALEARQAGDLEVLPPSQTLGDVGELADLLDDGPRDGWARVRPGSIALLRGCGGLRRCLLASLRPLGRPGERLLPATPATSLVEPLALHELAEAR